MEKVNVRLVPTGSIFKELDVNRICKWDFCLFQVECIQERCYLPQKSDIVEDDLWAYSDVLLEASLPVFNPSKKNSLDLTLFILDAPIEDNYLIRIIGHNRIVLTYYDAREFLLKENIPLENYLISNIYTFVLLLLAKFRSGQEPVLTPDDENDITHDYREGCIYDMCGTKEDIVYSCVKPVICKVCEKYLTEKGIKTEEINDVNKELKRLERTLYYSVVQELKAFPFIAFFLSCFLAFCMSVIANFATGNNNNPRLIIWIFWFALVAGCFAWRMKTKKHL